MHSTMTCKTSSVFKTPALGSLGRRPRAPWAPQHPSPAPGRLSRQDPGRQHPNPRSLQRTAPQAMPGASDLMREVPMQQEMRSDLPAWLSLAAYAALHLANFPAKFVPTTELLFTSLAWYQLAWAALTLVTSRLEFDKVGAVVAPAFLAVRALPVLASRLSPFNTAAGLFGYYLAKDLPGPVWAWLPTLAYAIYSGYASQWAVAAFGLAALLKLVRSLRSGGQPPVQQLAFVGLAAYGFYSGRVDLLAMLVFGGQLVASAIS